MLIHFKTVPILFIYVTLKLKQTLHINNVVAGERIDLIEMT